MTARHRSTAETGRPAPRLYLVTPRLADPESFSSALAAALGAGDIAAVLLRLEAADHDTLVGRIKAIAPAVQDTGAALLIDGPPAIVRASGADGAHLPHVTALAEAIPRLKPDHIAGCGGLESRHDAMTAGELGADYVMFGEPDAQGGRAPSATVLERASWWAELFVAPCVAWAATLDEVGALAAARADFVAIGNGDMLWTDSAGPAAIVAAALARLKVAEPVL